MSNVDPLGQRSTQRSDFAIGPQTDYNDPTAMLMVLSAQQLSILQSTMTAQISGLSDQANLLSRVGHTSKKLIEARDKVLQDERSDAQQILNQLHETRAEYLQGDSSQLQITPADNERFKQLESWAALRGYVVSPITRQVTVVTEQPQPKATDTVDASSEAVASEIAASDAAEVAADEMVKVETVIDVVDAEAVEKNVRMLLQYVENLNSNTIDNAAIRQRIDGLPGIDQLRSAAAELAGTKNLQQLSDFSDAFDQAQTVEQSVKTQLLNHTAAMRVIQRRAEEITTQSRDKIKQQDRTDQSARDRKDLADALRRQELSDAMHREVVEAIQAAESLDQVILNQALSADQLQQTLVDMPTTLREQFDRNVEHWQTDLNRDLASVSQSQSPKSTGTAAMRRSYL